MPSYRNITTRVIWVSKNSKFLSDNDIQLRIYGLATGFQVETVLLLAGKSKSKNIVLLLFLKFEDGFLLYWGLKKR